MFQKILFPIFIAIFLFACSENKTPSDSKDSTEKFSELADDKEFRDKHEEPSKIDFQPLGEMMKIPTGGGTTANVYYLKHPNRPPNFLLVFHEWWGLNDHVKKEAERLFKELGNTNVVAIDLYDGKVTDKREEAGKYMQATTTERAETIINTVLKMATQSKVATIGWCFGGGWSLKASILAGEQGAGCVMYYGMPVQDAEKLNPLKADVLGIFAKQDGHITPKVVNNFDGLMKANGKNFTFKQFDADHAFANPSSPRYVKTAAQEANQMALAFLKERLK